MKSRMLAWALKHRAGAQTLVRYYRLEAARLREYEASALAANNEKLAAEAARGAVMVEDCWEVNQRRLNFWDMVACWLGAASVVPGRGLNF